MVLEALIQGNPMDMGCHVRLETFLSSLQEPHGCALRLPQPAESWKGLPPARLAFLPNNKLKLLLVKPRTTEEK